MQYFFSKSTGGFYVDVIHGSNLPPDSVRVTKEEHTALLIAQTQGKVIQGDSSGRPVAIDPPPLSEDEQATADAVAAEAELSRLATRSLPTILQFILGDEAAKATAKEELQLISEEGAAKKSLSRLAEIIRSKPVK